MSRRGRGNPFSVYATSKAEVLVWPCPIGQCEMVEVAPGLFQCPWHGWGPSTQGFGRYVAYHDVVRAGDVHCAVFVEWLMYERRYRLGELTWADDAAMGRGLWEKVLDYADLPEEWEPLPCPVICDAGKWEMLPNSPRLPWMGWSEPTGAKFMPSRR